MSLKMDYSISNFIKFADQLNQYINPETSRNITLLVHRLFDNYNIDLSYDVRKVNFDKLIDETYSSIGISESAKKAYLRRLRSGLRYFTQFNNGEEVKVIKGGKKLFDLNMRNQVSNIINNSKEDEHKKIEVSTFSLPIPLRKELLLNISNLPLDLTEDEAEKIARIIQSYAVKKN